MRCITNHKWVAIAVDVGKLATLRLVRPSNVSSSYSKFQLERSYERVLDADDLEAMDELKVHWNESMKTDFYPYVLLLEELSYLYGLLLTQSNRKC